jgi:hypothetical protein
MSTVFLLLYSSFSYYYGKHQFVHLLFTRITQSFLPNPSVVITAISNVLYTLHTEDYMPSPHRL